MKIIESFQTALHYILNSDECDKVMNHTSRRERKAISEIRNYYKGKDKEQLHFLPLTYYLHKAPSLLCDILVVMMMNDEEE